MDLSELEAKALQIRKDILRLAKETGHGHIAPALSCVEILVALYYEVMGPDDVFIMSKGHGALALYAVLLWRRGEEAPPRVPGKLAGCLEHGEYHRSSTGSLGHGLPFAVGIALAKKLRGAPGRIYCLVGDAELQEGSCEEAFGLIRQLKLKNIFVAVDENGFGAMQKLPGRMSMFSFDGHSLETLTTMLDFNSEEDNERFVSFVTVKGKGVPFMQGKAEWHFRHPSTPEELSWIDSFLSSETTTDASSST